MRKISREGLELIKQWEGLRLEAYRDLACIWTIGYGHTNNAGTPLVKKGMRITKEEAEKILCEDLKQFEKTVEESVTVSLTDNQFAALVSFCYNVGTKAFCKSTLLKKLNQGDYEAVPGELQKWNKVGGKPFIGLVNRRAAEAGLWVKGSYIASNYERVETRSATGLLKIEALAPIIGSCSGFGGFLVGNGPVQWALAGIMVLAACTGLVIVAKRFKEQRL
ncbi:lysozyme [Bartonella krasnovii]|uniref:Lysozyme n=1 Tax=Bartonella krasnovii TaxID=2267275 RepID=A0A5B9D0U1_9HYPH|nr:glycoside hydrolase family protein [Bartonella krasnovii]QEE11960.1 phage lysozyme R [Bartonella krasnovii]QEE12261.1 phage lysozyme R [Bartonella krasnovii]UNF37402.1 glycoside hydrolase family protein [Bartonella krasnovii]UNF37820.1 glycoside hydrolase family protein [Bartonella krasnovii]UNF37869.1 glycoside hydrolase family protein [Bartonella krasnovii]